MAVVGEAYVVVRAISDKFKSDIQSSVNGLDSIGEKAGRDISSGYNKGLRKGGGGSSRKFFTKSDEADAEQARLLFRRLSIAQNFLVTGIPAVLGALGSLGSGLVVLAGVLGNAARGSIVLVSALGGLVQAGIAAQLAFKGVGSALSAGLKAQENSTANTRAQESAVRRLRDARLDLKRLIEEEKPEALAAAREAAVDAEEAAADALLNTERATRTYNQAQKNSLDALDDLNDARDDAREKLQQLRFEVEGGAISEKKARLQFEKSRDALQRVQDLPPNSRARQEAELAFAEADLNLRRAIDSNKDLKKEEQGATKAGVEGSAQVVRAKEDIANAQQAEVDSSIAAARAVRDLARAQEDAANAVSNAGPGGDAERDIDRRISTAREAVKLAEEAAADASSGGIDEYRKSLEKLSPEAQDFVKFLVAQKDAFEGLRAAAGRELFPGLTTALTIIIGKFEELEPFIQETGRILGVLATDFAETFFAGENFERLKRVWTDNNGLLELLGGAVINLAEGLLILLDNAGPLVKAFGDWAFNTSEAWKNTQILKDESGELTTEFANLQDRITRLTGIFGNYKEAFGGIFDVINAPGGAGDLLITYFEEASQSFVDFVKAGEKDGSLDKFFKDSVANFTILLDIFKNLGIGILNLGASDGVGQFLKSIDNIVIIFNELGLELAGKDGPIAKLGEFAEQFAIFLVNFTDTGTLNAFFDVLITALTLINTIVGSEIAQSFIKAVAPIAGFLLGVSVLRQGLLFAKVTAEGLFAVFINFLRPILGFFSNIAFSLAGKGGIIGLIGKVAGVLGRVFSFLIRFAGPIGIIVSILIVAVPIIIKYWDEIIGFFKGLIDGIVEGFTNLWGGIVDLFSAGIENIKNFLQPLIDFVTAYFTAVFDIIRGIVEVIVAIFTVAFVLIATVVLAVWDKIKAGFKVVSDFLKPIIDKIAGFFSAVFGKVGDFVVGIWDKIKKGFQKFLDFVKPGIDKILGFFENVFGKVESFFKGVMNTLIGFAEGFINFFIDGLNNIIGAINKLNIPIPAPIRGLFGGEKSLGFDIRPVNRIRLPRLAEGGLVKATNGGIAALIGEGGRNERIEPLDPSGLSKRDRALITQLSGGGNGGTTINVYPSAGMDERDLADLVSRKLAFELRRGAA
jgi:phage-related protein